MNKEQVLVVDDDNAVRKTLSDILVRCGFDVTPAASGTEALDLVKKNPYAVAILDQNMPGITGIETLRQMREIDPDVSVIIYTGHPSVDSSIEALHENVFDYLRKPVDMRTLQRTVQRAAERRRLIMENKELLRQIQMERDGLQMEVAAAKRAIEQRLANSDSFIGKSEVIKQVRHFVAEVAPSDMTVLLLGESGSGKDVLARLIHQSSGRDPNAFVKINCPAIPETLLESELFGHEPGAFTGAERRKPGRFELASKGTIFLDEIGDLPLSLQAKLLQVIEQKQFTHLGGSKTIKVDVRIIAATNAKLDEMTNNGSFRTDLFYRLNEYAIHLPPLRERPDDVPLLAQHFLQLYGVKYNRPGLNLSPETLHMMQGYTWPGNVRELESVIRRYALEANEDTVRQALAGKPGIQPVNAPAPVPTAAPTPQAPPGNRKTAAEAVRETEIETISKVLMETRWNQRKAAEILGMSYSSLRRRIAKYDLKNRSVS